MNNKIKWTIHGTAPAKKLVTVLSAAELDHIKAYDRNNKPMDKYDRSLYNKRVCGLTHKTPEDIETLNAYKKNSDMLLKIWIEKTGRLGAVKFIFTKN